MQNKVVFWIPDRHCDSPLLKSMFLAAINRHAVTIRYSSTYAESTRTIIPVGLYAMNGLWYLPAYCTTAKQIRVFRVDRIKEIIEEKPCPKGKYPIPASIQEYLEKTEDKKDYHIKIQLTDIGVKRCESECLLASGLKIIPTGGGIIDMEISHAALEWVADYILPFGNNATVLEPVELIGLMKQKAYELYQHYCQLK
ncbi:MAG: WYL domain-containing protein [Kineothrix sp.]|nr:WYL domain-containing protein [Kineothrix sp.]